MKNNVKEAYRQSKNIYDDVLTQNKWWSKLYIDFFWGVRDVEITKKLFSFIADDFSGKLLDVPCGTINQTAEKYVKLRNADITCLDYSEDMLEVARTRVKRQNLSNVSTLQGDVGKLPFEDNTFDAVLSMNGFHAFSDKKRAYNEIARVLKTDGMFCGCFYICGENRRSDFVVNSILARKGWFNPPFQTKEEVYETLQKYYINIEIYSDQAMVWFRCENVK